MLATVATGRTDNVIASGERNPAVALTEGFQDAFLVGAGMAILAALLAAVLISSKDSRARRGGLPRRGRAGPGSGIGGIPRPRGVCASELACMPGIGLTPRRDAFASCESCRHHRRPFRRGSSVGRAHD